MDSTTIAVDVAKAVFEGAVSAHPGQVRERHRFSRDRFRRYLGEQSPTTILMEACGFGSLLGASGPGARPPRRPVAPHTVRPYVLRNKTDRGDAKGLLEAVRNDEVRPVPVKSETQQAVAALHRLRSTGLGTRTARINTVRGLLREFGVVIPIGARQSCPPSAPPWRTRTAACRACCAWPSRRSSRRSGRSKRGCAIEHQLDAVAEQMPLVSALRSIPGIGLLTATALVATVGDVQGFPSARHFASYLGLTPREHSTGHQRRLGAISKRGDRDVRILLIHGARAVLCHAKTKTAPAPDRLRTWALQSRADAGPQQGGRRLGQQAGAHRLGRLEDRAPVYDRRGLRRAPNRGAHRGLLREDG